VRVALGLSGRENKTTAKQCRYRLKPDLPRKALFIFHWALSAPLECRYNFVMSRGACTFRKRNVTAAIKAVAAAGVVIARVEVDKDGKIVIIVGEPNESEGSNGNRSNTANEWDEVFSGADKTSIRQ